MSNEIPTNEMIREQLTADIQSFLANGGDVVTIPFGVSGEEQLRLEKDKYNRHRQVASGGFNNTERHKIEERMQAVVDKEGE